MGTIALDTQQRFRNGRNEVNDHHRSNRPSTSVRVENIDAIRSLIENEPTHSTPSTQSSGELGTEQAFCSMGTKIAAPKSAANKGRSFY